MIKAYSNIEVAFDQEEIAVVLKVFGSELRLPVLEAQQLSFEIDAATRECTADNAKFRVQQRERLKDIAIEDLEISVRTFNCLKSRDLHTIGDVADYGVTKMQEIKHMGRKSINEIREVFRHMCVDLAD